VTADRSIQSWLNNYEQECQVDSPRVLRGRCCLLNTAAIADLCNLKLVAKSPAIHHDLPISISALCNVISLVRMRGLLLIAIVVHRLEVQTYDYVEH
jgi:hypothetical protein